MAIHPYRSGLPITMQFDTPEKPLVAGVSNKIQEKQHPIFWFENPNGEFFFTKETEAWEILSGRIKIQTPNGSESVRHKYLGMSSGEIYFEGIKKLNGIFREKGIEEAQQYLIDLQEQERQSADKSKRPRNFDKTINGLPAQFSI